MRGRPLATALSSSHRLALIAPSLGPPAATGLVHLLGGSAALVGAWILGPRHGRFTADGHLVDLPGCNPAQAALGTFILWLG